MALPTAQPSTTHTPISRCAARTPVQRNTRFGIFQGAALAAAALGLWWLVRAAAIPPMVAGDNAYIFLAADRLYAGMGATCPLPHAPLQPWTWRSDWTFLTQWPVGYPALLWLMRVIFGLTLVQAGQALAAGACAAAAVGWFVFTRRCLLSRGLQPARPHSNKRPLPCATSDWVCSLIAAVSALSTVTADRLFNPSSDMIIVAAMPWCLLGVCSALSTSGSRIAAKANAPSYPFVLLGAAMGLLAWIRYAGLFVPLGMGAFLVASAVRGNGPIQRRNVIAFVIAVSIPVGALLMLNHFAGGGGSTLEMFNLGHRLEFRFDWGMLSEAWLRFTEQTIYAHRPEGRWFFTAVLPIAAVALPFTHRTWRARTTTLWRRPAYILSLASVITLIGLLIAATSVFGDKFHYVGLARYYAPIRPLYFLFFLTPLAALPHRALKTLLCVPLVAAALWMVNEDGLRAYRRWSDAHRSATPLGRWARYFEPDSTALYGWLRETVGDDLLVISNFPDEIALETWIPACPIPNDADELAAWQSRAALARGVPRVRVMFVLNPTNHTRDYYLPPVPEVLNRFGLEPWSGAPKPVRAYVFAYSDQ